ncbi:Bax inhibitor-1/YccA family protein [candidate division KSB1 bacterium]|nr:Bax inhibitor-1/YccA family protein [candidate division KSB1 bacterium]
MNRSMEYARNPVAVINAFLMRVYNWMGLGLAVTALVSMMVASSPTLLQMIFGNSFLFFGLIIGELVLVVSMSAAINRIQASTAVMLFFLYSALNGLTLSFIFIAYTRASITSTFFITAATFGALSLYGYSTRRDLTAIGSFMYMGLIGIIIASVVNMFLHSSAVYWTITYLGVLIFVGLTAYDTQKIKQMALSDFANEDMEQKASVIGALRLYLDFINLFLLLLRISGRRQ